jgi:hypothetical protein
MSGWTIAAIGAGIWLWGQFFGFGEATGQQAPAPDPAVSVPAER